MDFLTEVDKLVQLIECPIFTCKGPAAGLGWPGVQRGGTNSEQLLAASGERGQPSQGCLCSVQTVRLGVTG